MKITLIAGARPNFMKIAPIIDALKKHNAAAAEKIEYRLVHTGQHYDKNMSESFFDQLGIPHPDANLESGGGTQAEQTGNIMVRFEKELMENPADVVLVVGDVTSTLACSIVAKKLGIDVVHVEAGIRSFDLSMPEEINRMVTDAISDHFFTTSETANNNLRKAGVPENRIHFVGNTMIDTLLTHQPNFVQPPFWNAFGLTKGKYIVTTLHRPANVDGEQKLKTLVDTIIECAGDLPVVFPVHPRTAKNLQSLGIQTSNLFMVEPMPYLEFNYLVQYAKAVITDSGGITEETTVMHVPCITLRNNTERPETIEVGTNELIGTDPQNLYPAFQKLVSGNWKKGSIPDLWDGKTSGRIVSTLVNIYSK
ncbi:UDP-N-acetylglucosamine 2-epimerase (non-hydrolyzing) [Sediminibacterium roseum]|uniref:UDP-N-acetylglucosamine 2-epimerase (Non-hydrolyzing) n=1 Tax=Sediminibacterium roseum TaxID=1978412 RepID=A0ABW9ZQB2_9BACT|nr:UDP-N-acetylglucosamine 2-epimerase (non-hydrolyzing) [Sediminibacterium roseum]NCI49104.1 UDP-N-acetylglucosamine 2-epimerase (non-hydrolyzing) [Sediminibacterium roseum]